jgi:hypothetical protein
VPGQHSEKKLGIGGIDGGKAAEILQEDSRLDHLGKIGAGGPGNGLDVAQRLPALVDRIVGDEGAL